MIRKCLSCGGGDFIGGVELLDTGEYAKGVATLCLEVEPSAMLFKDRKFSKVEVFVCADCGFVHSYAADLTTLLAARAVRDMGSNRGKKVGFQGEKKEYRCGNCDTVHVFSECPKCGVSAV